MTAPSIAASLARAAELDAAASKGPWAVNPLNAIVDAFVGGIQLAVCKLLWPTKDRTEQETEANAAFIAESRALLPQMAAEVSRQAEEIERLRAENVLRRNALADVAVMLNTELKDYDGEPWAKRVRAALSFPPAGQERAE